MRVTSLLLLPLLVVAARGGPSQASAIGCSLGRPVAQAVLDVPRGGASWFAGMHPFGYKLSALGAQFLELEGARNCDVGRFLASFKSTLKGGRKTTSAIKSEWLELVRYAKTGEASRIYRTVDTLLAFVVKAGFIE
uniref:Uncharacterized protein n=1 Tax=Rhizochromulina marina TaxID=1034831 RepID=A0A7S2WTW5_9STRA|mmetsp:Transcript_5256/g.15433  ORF Transcript_5256/g.15433 Transcript_5256/m.15433 type:complete len:136 (+) Transcript_5256:55-462(+)